MEVLSGNVFFWTLVTFGILVYILGKYGWKPIINALDNRIESIKNDIAFAEREKERATKIVYEQKEVLSKARNEAQGIISHAKKEADVMKDEILSKARIEAKNVVEKARQDIESSKTSAIEELKNEMGKLSLDIASKVIEKSLDPKDHQELISKALSQYQHHN